MHSLYTIPTDALLKFRMVRPKSYFAQVGTVYTYKDTYIHVYIHSTHTHTYIHTYTHTCIYTYIHIYLLTTCRRVLLEKLTGFQLVKKSPNFMEPEGSLPHLQVPATCPYLEQDESNPCPHIPLPEDPSQCYPPIYAWILQVVSFPQVSPHLLSSPTSRVTCPTHLILLDFITRTIFGEECRSLGPSLHTLLSTHTANYICIQTAVRLKYSFRHTGTWSAAAGPSRHLCPRPDVLCRPLSIISLPPPPPKKKIRRSFQKCYFIWFLLLNCFSVKLRTASVCTGSLRHNHKYTLRSVSTYIHTFISSFGAKREVSSPQNKR